MKKIKVRPMELIKKDGICATAFEEEVSNLIFYYIRDVYFTSVDFNIYGQIGRIIRSPNRKRTIEDYEKN